MSKTLDELKGDIIDSRDLIEAMEEWEAIANDDDATEEEREEAQANLKELKEFCEPFEGYSNWKYGEALIEADYWEQYVEDLIKDCGYIPHDLPHWIAIDWEKTAEAVAQDYMFENDYYMRCV